MSLNATHDPSRRSWVESANLPATDFPLQNLPYGAFCTAANPNARIGAAIGDHVLDLRAAAEAGLLPATVAPACTGSNLNSLLALGLPGWSELRAALSTLLGDNSCPAGPSRERV